MNQGTKTLLYDKTRPNKKKLIGTRPKLFRTPQYLEKRSNHAKNLLSKARI